MDWVEFTTGVVIPLLERFGFPVVCALGSLGLAGAILWKTQVFIACELTDLIKRCTAALTAQAETSRELAEKIDQCPGHDFRARDFEPAAAATDWSAPRS